MNVARTLVPLLVSSLVGCANGADEDHLASSSDAVATGSGVTFRVDGELHRELHDALGSDEADRLGPARVVGVVSVGTPVADPESEALDATLRLETAGWSTRPAPPSEAGPWRVELVGEAARRLFDAATHAREWSMPVIIGYSYERRTATGRVTCSRSRRWESEPEIYWCWLTGVRTQTPDAR